MPATQRRPLVLITGASSGIGEALSHCFAQAQHDLVLVARSADKLQALARQIEAQYPSRVQVVPLDLTLPDGTHQLATALKARRRLPDVLVNCAGVLAQQPFVRMKSADHQGVIDLNISALTAIMSHFLPLMIKRGSGRVLNVASIAAFQPVPLLATYAASKAYVLSLTESLSQELQGSGVSITALCPGITATPMLQAATQGNAQLNQLPGFLIGDVQDVARQGFEACMKGDVICVPGIINQAAVLASRSTPKWLMRRVSDLLSRLAS
ncbi:MAG: SDR family oxidoreductase [Gammaproteobacteria bacterium]|uniref:SDR family NAD(P)-dependent oxidoreductase n=1 Tax=Rhodoferax sp. TaxID=50421 RepID=UPI00178E8F57|nr:SDR family oxidoreductase [Rhodoferax sp.]MBU3900049.1 SDR family oxidoreductase [Gammaproteobacteria bacterium]MBA3059724.1 SDR family oxidoreductase [Rhodoferax sp.]MBU3999413.1 SDR family oxidoreductase [Gammaproteobacteria bacterium]MBU4082087.1 SDR family oxidoreductase [Gammaproteobacteria bacterium]MBU4113882.1 SDR family oxidoreductase [Gammaproteobacteria bacterium]